LHAGRGCDCSKKYDLYCLYFAICVTVYINLLYCIISSVLVSVVALILIMLLKCLCFYLGKHQIHNVNECFSFLHLYFHHNKGRQYYNFIFLEVSFLRCSDQLDSVL
jgi:hypothetical protein